MCGTRKRPVHRGLPQRGFVDALLAVAVAFGVRVVTDTLMPMAYKRSRVAV